MRHNLDRRKFTLISNTAGNAKPGETVFAFEQKEGTVRALYSGGGVRLGAIVGMFVDDETLEVLFQQVTTEGVLNGGKGSMKLEQREDGKLYFVDDWSFLINGSASGRAVWKEL